MKDTLSYNANKQITNKEIRIEAEFMQLIGKQYTKEILKQQVKLFIEKYPDVETQLCDFALRSTQTEYIRWENFKVVQEILAGPEVIFPKVKGHTDDLLMHKLLMTMISRYDGSSNFDTLLKKIIETGVNINSLDSKWSGSDYNEHVLLHQAVKISSAKCILMLLHGGADINLRDLKGQTPLHVAVKYAYSDDMLKFLIDKGADLSPSDQDGNTPLHLAVVENSDMIPVLIKGSDLNAKNVDGHTPLMLAIASNDKQTAHLLLSYYDLKNLSDQDFNILIEWAQENFSEEYVEQLVADREQETSEANYENTLVDNNESMGLQEPPMTSEGHAHNSDDLMGQESPL
jgi:ankyrin repeat protein